MFDTLRRYLEHKGYEVKYVQNFTDIDDKMIRRANEEGITVKELGDRFIKEYYTDADALGIERATVNPRATEHIPDIIALIEKLIDKGLAYACDNGDVYYNTQAFPGYGKLCGQNLEDLESGARIDVDPNKRHPMDFAFWIQLHKVSDTDTRMRLVLHIELNMMMKMMIGGKLQGASDQIAEGIARAMQAQA